MHHLHDPLLHKDPKPIKFYEPREDPRLFYQSVEYLQEIAPKDLNNEVSYIYPGREVIRPDEMSRLRIRTFDPNLQDSIKYNVINQETPCVRCPHDRTLIAKPGSDRVVLQFPRLQSCSHSRRLPRNVRFVHMYGPNFGSLLEPGTHVVVGKIVQNYKTLQMCKMQINVVLQTCTIPKSLIAHCEPNNKNCNFTCRDTKLELHGPETLSCEGGKKWSGNLPVCKASAHTWCMPLFPPEHGRISCKGATTADGAGLLEGSTCRMKCQRGWKWAPRTAAVCRRGVWSHRLTCQPKRF
ncbi:uncharacterized protein LOC128679592 isoform X2 [Plodia interpunctella]|nr:uncharacterized protein LOC128679592 isoform X2 [Plodia interpunctella]XP_053617932.1 uncharacterized protein LOC128679592 isoform X2 [Plodia interpunctella]